MAKEIIIDGNNFTNLSEFYDEVESKFTKGLGWRIGRNLNAYNDVLVGGFGVHDYEEPIKIRWTNSDKSKEHLGRLFDTIIEITVGHEHIQLKIE